MCCNYWKAWKTTLSQAAHSMGMTVLTHNVAQTDYTWHLCQKLLCSVFYCVAMFRRPEGKFKMWQNPRDEALQILRPQMDNPPAPQVDAPTPENFAISDFSRFLELYTYAEQISKFPVSVQPKRPAITSPLASAVKETESKPTKSTKKRAPQRPLPIPPPGTHT